MENCLKISFLGDITCDRPMLKAAMQSDGSFDFDTSLEKLKELFQDSDLVVGNLETVCAGQERGYNPGAVVYNSPDELIAALKRVGITMVTTANNHTLDCGVSGLHRTLDVLDQHGILHTGAVKKPDAPIEDRYLVYEKDGIRIAIVAMTATMNKKVSGQRFTDAEWNSVNELRAAVDTVQAGSMKQRIKRLLPMKLIAEIRAIVKRAKGIPLIATYADNYSLTQADQKQIQWAKDLLQHAREHSDFVVACVHSGGQFNAEPGSFSINLYKELEPYTDAIIGNHPHVVQKLAHGKNGQPIAYSLGSLNMSQSSDYVNKENAPEFSIMLDLHLCKNAEGTLRLFKKTFTLLYAKEDEKGYLKVIPWMNETEDKDNNVRAAKVSQRFWGKDNL